MLAKLDKRYWICYRKPPHPCPLQTAGRDQQLETTVGASVIRELLDRCLLPDAVPMLIAVRNG
jgi:hypothetical protein